MYLSLTSTLDDKSLPPETTTLKRVRRFAGVLGVIISAAFLLWVPAGFIPAVPSLLDVFGLEGLRTPASFAVGGLVLAAIGFFEP